MAKEICSVCGKLYDDDDADDGNDLCICGVPVCSPAYMDNHLSYECEDQIE